VAALWLIGGIDSRLRLGGTVRHDEFGCGTVASIATSGKISVQFDGVRNMKTCRMQDLEPVSSSSVSSVRSSAYHCYKVYHAAVRAWQHAHQPNIV